MRFLVAVLFLAASLSGCAEKAAETRTVVTTREVVVIETAPPVEHTASTGGIEGTVFDEEQAPVPGATVTLVGRGLETSSDLAGLFTFSNLEPGEYKLTVRKSGFATTGRGLSVVPGEIAFVKVSLRVIAFDVPYTKVHDWTGFILVGYFVVNVGDQPPTGSQPNTCSACIVPCTTCFKDFNVSANMKSIVLELRATRTVSSPGAGVTQNDYFWQLLAKSKNLGRVSADYWVSPAKRQLNGGWNPAGDDLRATNQCGLYWFCVNQKFTVYFSQFYFQEPVQNYTALPPS